MEIMRPARFYGILIELIKASLRSPLFLITGTVPQQCTERDHPSTLRVYEFMFWWVPRSSVKASRHFVLYSWRVCDHSSSPFVSHSKIAICCPSLLACLREQSCL